MSGGNAIRGTRVGAGPMGESERGESRRGSASATVARTATSRGRRSPWRPRCRTAGTAALRATRWSGPGAPARAAAQRAVQDHLAYVKERRSTRTRCNPGGALAKLRAQRELPDRRAPPLVGMGGCSLRSRTRRAAPRGLLRFLSDRGLTVVQALPHMCTTRLCCPQIADKPHLVLTRVDLELGRPRCGGGLPPRWRGLRGGGVVAWGRLGLIVGVFGSSLGFGSSPLLRLLACCQWKLARP